MMLLLIDAANVLMRCAFGGEIPPEQSTPNAVAMVDRAAKELGASHLVIALDYPGAPSWRKLEYSDYKANRSIDTAPWLVAGASAFARQGWHCEVHTGFEADDVIATIALRTAPRADVLILSNDSDLLPLTTNGGIVVVRPLAGGDFQNFIAPDVVEKYRIPSAASLIDYKAMVGEKSDNIAGVPGIGPVKACALLHKFATLEAIIHAGNGGYSKESALVAKHADSARLAQRLISLRPDAPVPPIDPRSCSLHRKAA